MKMMAVVAGVVLSVIALASGAGEFNESSGVAIKGYDPVAFLKRASRYVVRTTCVLITKVRRSSLATQRIARIRCRSREVRSAVRWLLRVRTARGYKADIDPATFAVVDGRLYLNYNTQVQREWVADSSALYPPGR